MKASCIYFTGILFLLTGCGEEAKTIAYYEAHLDEAKAMKEECKIKEKNGAFDGQNPLAATGELLSCQNAMHVVMRIKHRPTLGDEPVQKTW
jgi:hypothetical protein